MRYTLLALSLPFAAALPAQDMIATSWSGGVYALDSFTGATTYLGVGLFGQNAMAVDQTGVVWSTHRDANNDYSLCTVDLSTGAATEIYTMFGDTRGLAGAGGTALWGIQKGPDRLVLIETTTGSVTTIGTIGLSGTQSLAMLDGTLYSWSITNGLLTIDQTTGQGTAIDPSQVTGIGGEIQWLARRSDGKLVGGGNNLYELDPTTGVATLIATTGLELRGAEPAYGYVHNFGAGCDGAGGQVSSSASFSGGGATVDLQSTNHDANTIGLVLFGVSNSESGGNPLPLLIDPIFGTQNCWLLVSPDVSIGAVTTASFPATLDLQIPVLPGWEGFALFAQHVVLENVPGGLSMSDGVLVQFGY